MPHLSHISPKVLIGLVVSLVVLGIIGSIGSFALLAPHMGTTSTVRVGGTTPTQGAFPHPTPFPSGTTLPGVGRSPTPTPIGVHPTPTKIAVVPPVHPLPTVVPSTPVPVSVLVASDSFHRADQDFWGQSTGGAIWTGDANINADFSISNGSGQVCGTGLFNALLGPVATNVDVQATGSLAAFAFGQTNFGVVARWTDANNWYKAYIDGQQLVILKSTGGQITVLKSASFLAQDQQAYSLRLRVVGTSLLAKAWLSTASEPTGWNISASDGTLQHSGFAGMRIVVQDGDNAQITAFSVRRIA